MRLLFFLLIFTFSGFSCEELSKVNKWLTSFNDLSRLSFSKSLSSAKYVNVFDVLNNPLYRGLICKELQKIDFLKEDNLDEFFKGTFAIELEFWRDSFDKNLYSILDPVKLNEQVKAKNPEMYAKMHEYGIFTNKKLVDFKKFRSYFFSLAKIKSLFPYKENYMNDGNLSEHDKNRFVVFEDILKDQYSFLAEDFNLSVDGVGVLEISNKGYNASFFDYHQSLSRLFKALEIDLQTLSFTVDKKNFADSMLRSLPSHFNFGNGVNLNKSVFEVINAFAGFIRMSEGQEHFIGRTDELLKLKDFPQVTFSESIQLEINSVSFRPAGYVEFRDTKSFSQFSLAPLLAISTHPKLSTKSQSKLISLFMLSKVFSTKESFSRFINGKGVVHKFLMDHLESSLGENFSKIKEEILGSPNNFQRSCFNQLSR